MLVQVYLTDTTLVVVIAAQLDAFCKVIHNYCDIKVLVMVNFFRHKLIVSIFNCYVLV